MTSKRALENKQEHKDVPAEDAVKELIRSEQDTVDLWAGPSRVVLEYWGTAANGKKLYEYNAAYKLFGNICHFLPVLAAHHVLQGNLTETVEIVRMYSFVIDMVPSVRNQRGRMTQGYLLQIAAGCGEFNPGPFRPDEKSSGIFEVLSHLHSSAAIANRLDAQFPRGHKRANYVRTMRGKRAVDKVFQDIREAKSLEPCHVNGPLTEFKNTLEAGKNVPNSKGWYFDIKIWLRALILMRKHFPHCDKEDGPSDPVGDFLCINVIGYMQNLFSKPDARANARGFGYVNRGQQPDRDMDLDECFYFNRPKYYDFNRHVHAGQLERLGINFFRTTWGRAGHTAMDLFDGNFVAEVKTYIANKSRRLTIYATQARNNAQQNSAHKSQDESPKPTQAKS